MKSSIKYLIYFIFAFNSVGYSQILTSYIVKFKDINKPVKDFCSIAAESGIKELQIEISKELKSMEMEVIDLGVELNEADAEEVLLQLNADENIEYAEPNIPYYIDGIEEQDTKSESNNIHLSPTIFKKTSRSNSVPISDLPLSLSPRDRKDGQLSPRERKDGQLSPRERKEGQNFSLRREKNPQWARIAIDALCSKPLSLGEPSVFIALLDTGVDKNHKDLAHSFSDVVKSLDTIKEKETDLVEDLNGHGTHCAGIMVGSVNSKDVPGIAPYCKLIPIKVMHQNKNGEKPYALTSWVIRGIKHAVDSGAKVINLSLTSTLYTKAMEETIKYAQEKGCLVVAAAGNNNTNAIHYPAAYEGVLSVGAIDRNYKKLEESNFGDWVSVCAPGKDINSTFLNNSTKIMSGTSMACPHVSALAALLFSIGGESITAEKVKEIIETTCKKLGEVSQICKNGLIDVKEALEYCSKYFKVRSFSLVNSISTDLGEVAPEIFLDSRDVILDEQENKFYHFISKSIKEKKSKEYIRGEFTFNISEDQLGKEGWIRMKLKADQPIMYKISIYNKITGKYDVLIPYEKYSKENYDLSDDLNNDQVNQIINNCNDMYISSDKKLRIKLSAKSMDNFFDSFLKKKKELLVPFNLIVEYISYEVNNIDNILNDHKNKKPAFSLPYPLSISLSDPTY